MGYKCDKKLHYLVGIFVGKKHYAVNPEVEEAKYFNTCLL